MKKALAFISSLSGFLILAAPVFAQDKINICGASNNDFYKLCNFTTGDFGPLIGSLLTLIFVVSIVAALFYLVWGGFKWLTSGGDKTAVGAAREHIVAAIIGLVVIFLAYFILNILVTFFTGNSIDKITIPTLGQSNSGTGTATCLKSGFACLPGGTGTHACCGAVCAGTRGHYSCP